jgi:hypothetical protein
MAYQREALQRVFDFLKQNSQELRQLEGHIVKPYLKHQLLR